MQVALNGCIAQLARACGSYPQCHRFKSSYSHHHGPVVKRPKTPPFHGGNTGSNPVRVTKNPVHASGRDSYFLLLTSSLLPCPETPALYGWVLFFAKKDGMRTRGVRRSSPKPASGFRDCEVTSTAKCFGYRSQRSKHCRRRVSRPGHQKSRSRKWAGFLLFTSYLFTITSSGNS